MSPGIRELVQAGAWPAVALLAMLLFLRPLSRLIDRVTHVSVRRKDGVEYLIAAEKLESPGSVPAPVAPAPEVTRRWGRVVGPDDRPRPEAEVARNPVRGWLILGGAVSVLFLLAAMSGWLRFYFWVPVFAAASGAAYLLLEQLRLLPRGARAAAEPSTEPAGGPRTCRASLRQVRGLMLAIGFAAIGGMYLGDSLWLRWGREQSSRILSSPGIRMKEDPEGDARARELQKAVLDSLKGAGSPRP